MEKNKKRKTYIVGMIKRSTPRGSFESTSYDILVGIIKILVQVLLSANTMKKFDVISMKRWTKLGAFLKTIKFDTYTNVGKKIMRLGDIWGPGWIHVKTVAKCWNYKGID